MKKCSRCKKDKDLNLFNKNSSRKDGKQHMCKSCESEYGQENIKRIKNRRRERIYGISPEEYENILLKQNGKCAICKSDKSEFHNGLHIDHNHNTGKIRGLLCLKCNSAIGKFKDSIEILQEAIKYLETNK